MRSPAAVCNLRQTLAHDCRDSHFSPSFGTHLRCFPREAGTILGSGCESPASAPPIKPPNNEMHLSVRRIHRTSLPFDTVKLAKYLIGKTLVHDTKAGRISGRIVETEAYVVGDAAGHAYRGLTPRNKSLFLKRGHAYVYFSYGLHVMLNVSSEVPGVGAGVLLRALQPLDGIELMQRRRGKVSLIDLARGPGRLAQAMGVTLDDDGLDLCAAGPLWLGESVRKMGKIGVSVRIGISKEAHRLLRFYESGSTYVSGPKRLRVPGSRTQQLSLNETEICRQTKPPISKWRDSGNLVK